MVKAIRVGVVLDSTSELKPIVSLAVARDGGLMLTPAEIRSDGWSYGVAEVPGGVGHGLMGRIRREGVVDIPQRPKLHYHRSGFTSVNLTGKDAPRRSIRCLPLSQMRGDQCFGVQVDGVDVLPTKDPRSRDVFLVVQELARTAQRLRTSVSAEPDSRFGERVWRRQRHWPRPKPGGRGRD
jgi:hypothetical protein